MLWILLIIAIVLGIVLLQFSLIKASNKIKMPPPKAPSNEDKWQGDDDNW